MSTPTPTTATSPAEPRLRILQGLRGQKPAEIMAGVTLAALAIARNLGYAEVAGLAPVVGLYAAVLAMAVYALFSSSRLLVSGPDAAIAALRAGARSITPERSAARLHLRGVVWLNCGMAELRDTRRATAATRFEMVGHRQTGSVAAHQVLPRSVVDITLDASTFGVCRLTIERQILDRIERAGNDETYRAVVVADRMTCSACATAARVDSLTPPTSNTLAAPMSASRRVRSNCSWSRASTPISRSVLPPACRAFTYRRSTFRKVLPISPWPRRLRISTALRAPSVDGR